MTKHTAFGADALIERMHQREDSLLTSDDGPCVLQDVDLLRDARECIVSLQNDNDWLRRFADLWYFVMDEKPREFEQIVTTYVPSKWMDEAAKLKAANDR